MTPTKEQALLPDELVYRPNEFDDWGVIRDAKTGKPLLKNGFDHLKEKDFGMPRTPPSNTEDAAEALELLPKTAEQDRQFDQILQSMGPSTEQLRRALQSQQRKEN